MRSLIPLLVALIIAGLVSAQTLITPSDEGRRVSVLFFGAPTENHPGHDPITRYRVIKKALGKEGIDFTYCEDPAEALDANYLANFDALLMYGNWEQNGKMPAPQEEALLNFVSAGGGFLPIHCACGCYGGSPNFVSLVGAKFKSHESAVFAPETINQEHPITKGYTSFTAWDETYVHSDHNPDRTILQMRGEEPWTWVRNHGKGRVFYTASGHDHQVWDTPEFQDLIRRAILWTIGDAAAARLDALKLPKLEFSDAALPGHRPEETSLQAQEPLPVSESIKFAQVPPGYELAVFASEPDIVNPIAINWDAKGRAYVVETLDYPNNHQDEKAGNDRIKICEDTDGDQVADQFTVFASGLSIPTSVAFAYEGVIATNGDEILFLKDSDGDDIADIQKPFFKGFNLYDTHAGVSNLRVAPDGWIYATIGYAGFTGMINNQSETFHTGIFRFRYEGDPAIDDLGADGTLQQNVTFEFLQNTTNNTWGLDFTSDFRVMASTANSNPSMWMTFPRRIYEEYELIQPKTPRADSYPFFNPSSDDIRQVDQIGRYTAAAGHSFCHSDRFPASARNIALVCEPTGKLVGQFEVTENGSGFVSTQLPNNLYNSADAWSAPVAAEVGPDGAIWICDWYNIIIQHNSFPNVEAAGYPLAPGKGNAYRTPLRDREHGRIYRIYPKGSRNTQTAESVASQFLRSPKSQPEVLAALTSEDPTLRRLALPFAPLDETLQSLFLSEGKISETNLATQLELLLAFARLTPSETIAAALHSFQYDKTDIGLSDAYQVALRHHAIPFLRQFSKTLKIAEQSQAPENLIPDGSLEEVGNWVPRRYSNTGEDSQFRHSQTEGRDGSGCLVVTSPKNADVGWELEIAVKPVTEYRLSGFIRTENFDKSTGRGALFYIHGGEASPAVGAQEDWQEVTHIFKTGANQNTIALNCLLGGWGTSSGTAYFDDLRLEETGRDEQIGTFTNLARFAARRNTPADLKALSSALQAEDHAGSRHVASILQDASQQTAKERTFPPDPEIHQRGLAIYQQTCLACHGADGQGVQGVFPPLDQSEWVTEEATLPIKILLHGLAGPIEVQGQQFNSVMAPLGHLNDGEIADVLTYVRQSWNNDAAPVSPEAVAKVRSETSSRKGMWTAEELKK